MQAQDLHLNQFSDLSTKLSEPSLQAPETQNKLNGSDQFLTNVTEDLASALLAESYWQKREVRDSAEKFAASCHLDSFDSIFKDQICPKLFHLQ